MVPGGQEICVTRDTSLVLGLGNPLLGDDAVGLHVAQRVAGLVAGWPGVEVDTAGLGGLALMERLAGYHRVVLVDAMTGGRDPPGTVRRFALTDLPALALGHVSSVHDMTIQAALALGQRLGMNLPVQVDVVGVEALRVREFTQELTPSVAAAIPRAASLVLAILRPGRLGP
jgi:hydrogenase maturation protease